MIVKEEGKSVNICLTTCNKSVSMPITCCIRVAS